MVNMTNGVVKSIKAQEGYGFITQVLTGEDYFFHKSDVNVELETLKVNQPVTFTPGRGPKGPRAMAVKVVTRVYIPRKLGAVSNAKAIIANLKHDRSIWVDAKKDTEQKIADIDVRLEQYRKLLHEQGERE